MQDGGHTPANGLTEPYSLSLQRPSLILDIHVNVNWNSIQNKVSADTWSYRRLKFRAHHVFFYVDCWPRCWFSIGLRHVRLTCCKQAGLFGSGLMNWRIFFSCIQNNFFIAFVYFFVYFEIIQNQSRRPNNLQKTWLQSYKWNQLKSTNQIFRLSWPTLIRLWTTQYRSTPSWEVGTQESFIRGGSTLRSNPLPFYIPFFSEKAPLSYTFYWKKAPLSYTY